MTKNIKYDFSKVKEFGLSELDNELEQECSDAFNSLNLTQEQVDGVMKFFGNQLDRLVDILNQPKTDLKEEQDTLQKMWGNDYSSNIQLAKKFAETMPKKVLENPMVDTAEGISLILRLAKESNLTAFRTIN